MIFMVFIMRADYAKRLIIIKAVIHKPLSMVRAKVILSALVVSFL